MTPITYEDAANLLGMVPESVRHATARGVLTKLPRFGKAQPIIKEQVLLFQGKRLSLNALSDSELDAWQQLDRLSREPIVEQTMSLEMLEDLIEQRVASRVDPVMDAMGALLRQIGASYDQIEAARHQPQREVPKGVP